MGAYVPTEKTLVLLSTGRFVYHQYSALHRGIIPVTKSMQGLTTAEADEYHEIIREGRLTNILSSNPKGAV